MSSPASRPVPPAAASPLNLRGAVDLSSLKHARRRRPGARPPLLRRTAHRRPAAPPTAAPETGRPLRVDVTESNFQELVELSAQVPVVFAFGPSIRPESGQLSRRA